MDAPHVTPAERYYAQARADFEKLHNRKMQLTDLPTYEQMLEIASGVVGAGKIDLAVKEGRFITREQHAAWMDNILREGT